MRHYWDPTGQNVLLSKSSGKLSDDNGSASVVVSPMRDTITVGYFLSPTLMFNRESLCQFPGNLLSSFFCEINQSACSRYITNAGWRYIWCGMRLCVLSCIATHHHITCIPLMISVACCMKLAAIISTIYFIASTIFVIPYRKISNSAS